MSHVQGEKRIKVPHHLCCAPHLARNSFSRSTHARLALSFARLKTRLKSMAQANILVACAQDFINWRCRMRVTPRRKIWDESGEVFRESGTDNSHCKYCQYKPLSGSRYLTPHAFPRAEKHSRKNGGSSRELNFYFSEGPAKAWHHYLWPIL